MPSKRVTLGRTPMQPVLRCEAPARGAVGRAVDSGQVEGDEQQLRQPQQQGALRLPQALHPAAALALRRVAAQQQRQDRLQVPHLAAEESHHCLGAPAPCTGMHPLHVPSTAEHMTHCMHAGGAHEEMRVSTAHQKHECMAEEQAHLTVTRVQRKRLMSPTSCSGQVSADAACPASMAARGATMLLKCGSSSCACSWYLCSCSTCLWSAMCMSCLDVCMHVEKECGSLLSGDNGRTVSLHLPCQVRPGDGIGCLPARQPPPHVWLHRRMQSPPCSYCRSFWSLTGVTDCPRRCQITSILQNASAVQKALADRSVR